jgi:hypothetical protein
MGNGKEVYKQTLERFIRIYCRKKHRQQEGLCADCQDLLQYAWQRTDNCRQDPKPPCKFCPIHCYAPSYRQKIRQVMRVAGMHMILRGRLDWLIKYLLAR